MNFLLSALLLCVSTVVSAEELPPVRTVPYVDLQRYMGKWYEIAAYPQSFQKDCVKSQAEYSLRDDGKVNVVNSCRKKDGSTKVANGTAKVVDKASNAKLKVTFFWPFAGDYWIIDLGQDYEYVVVGAPNRDYLWILSRRPQMREATYQRILRGIESQKFSLEPLRITGKVVR
jgi:apolipoprotein D and lipocalin family protein